MGLLAAKTKIPVHEGDRVWFMKTLTIRNILFATDLSYAAEAALPYAIEIARLYGSKVFVVHVRPNGDELDAAKEIEELDERLHSVPHELVIEEGDVYSALDKQIAQKQIDLVVVGTHGRTGLGRVVVGSVAERIFREAPCPVLTVGPHLSVAPQWVLKIKEILYATDMTPESRAVAGYAISLAEGNQARLAILNVLPSPKTGELVHPEEYKESTLRRLRELVPPGAKLSCQPNCIVEQGDAAEKILDVAGRHHADLIVLGIRWHRTGVVTHLSRPTAHRVIAGAACPVLTVRWP